MSRLQYRPLEEGQILRQKQKPERDHPKSEDRELSHNRGKSTTYVKVREQTAH